MAKPDPALLDPARYPFHCALPTRFSDLDINRHINNVAMAGLLQEARVQFDAASGFYDVMVGIGAMVVSLGVEYLAQAYYPEPLDFHAGVFSVGQRSFELQQLARQGGRNVASARWTIVCVAEGKAISLPKAYIDSIGQWMIRP